MMSSIVNNMEQELLYCISEFSSGQFVFMYISPYIAWYRFSLYTATFERDPSRTSSSAGRQKAWDHQSHWEFGAVSMGATPALGPREWTLLGIFARTSFDRNSIQAARDELSNANVR
jgi:hypothetical protein